MLKVHRANVEAASDRNEVRQARKRGGGKVYMKLVGRENDPMRELNSMWAGGSFLR